MRAAKLLLLAPLCGEAAMWVDNLGACRMYSNMTGGGTEMTHYNKYNSGDGVITNVTGCRAKCDMQQNCTAIEYKLASTDENETDIDYCEVWHSELGSVEPLVNMRYHCEPKPSDDTMMSDDPTMDDMHPVFNVSEGACRANSDMTGNGVEGDHSGQMDTSFVKYMAASSNITTVEECRMMCHHMNCSGIEYKLKSGSLGRIDFCEVWHVPIMSVADVNTESEMYMCEIKHDWTDPHHMMMCEQMMMMNHSMEDMTTHGCNQTMMCEHMMHDADMMHANHMNDTMEHMIRMNCSDMMNESMHMMMCEHMMESDHSIEEMMMHHCSHEMICGHMMHMNHSMEDMTAHNCTTDDGKNSGSGDGSSNSENTQAVAVGFTIEGADYDALTADAAKTQDFKDQMAEEVAGKVEGVDADDVTISLSSGSIMVLAAFLAPEGTDTDAIATAINDDASGIVSRVEAAFPEVGSGLSVSNVAATMGDDTAGTSRIAVVNLLALGVLRLMQS